VIRQRQFRLTSADQLAGTSANGIAAEFVNRLQFAQIFSQAQFLLTLCIGVLKRGPSPKLPERLK